MRTGLLAAVVAASAAFGLQASAQESPNASALVAREPVVVELYTSQGCSSCPRANRLVREFRRDPDVLALTFPVGYWDYLGWADTFARPEFEERQRHYARAFQLRAPYTPQVIIGGAREVAAADWDLSWAVYEEVRGEVAVEAPIAPLVTVHKLPNGAARVDVSAGSYAGQPADIWFISFDPGPLTVQITSGENENRRVPHYNLVQRITRAGTWNGQPLWFERANCEPQCAILVQQPQGGPILAAAFTRDE